MFGGFTCPIHERSLSNLVPFTRTLLEGIQSVVGWWDRVLSSPADALLLTAGPCGVRGFPVLFLTFPSPLLSQRCLGLHKTTNISSEHTGSTRTASAWCCSPRGSEKRLGGFVLAGEAG